MEQVNNETIDDLSNSSLINQNKGLYEELIISAISIAVLIGIVLILRKIIKLAK